MGLELCSQHPKDETDVVLYTIQHVVSTVTTAMAVMRIRVDAEALAREKAVASLETEIAGAKRKYMDVLERLEVLEAGERETAAPSPDSGKRYGANIKRYKTSSCGGIRKMGPLLPKCVCIKGGKFMWQYVLHGNRTVQRGFDTPQHALDALVAYKASL